MHQERLAKPIQTDDLPQVSVNGCRNGCTVRGRHLSQCPVEDHHDGVWRPWGGETAGSFSVVGRPWLPRWGCLSLEVWFACRGCLPRRATHGIVCESCHNRLTDWLSGERGLVWTHGWLGENLARAGGSGARQDWQRPGGDEGPPLPIRPAIHDLRTLMSDRVRELEDCARDEFDRPSRSGPFDLVGACQFLTAWLTKIEEGDLVLHMYERLEGVMRDAAMIAPWRDAPRRIVGIPCPECEVEALAVYGGDEDVTCRNCWAVHTRRRYEIWTRMLAEQVRAS